MFVWRRPSILFLSFCLVVFGGLTALSVYKHLRYPAFTLMIRGSHSLTSSSGKKFKAVSASSNSVLTGIHTDWWGTETFYTITPNGIGPVLAFPTLRGGLVLTNLAPQGNAAYASIIMENMNGTGVQQMFPNVEYRLVEGDVSVVVTFHWQH